MTFVLMGKPCFDYQEEAGYYILDRADINIALAPARHGSGGGAMTKAVKERLTWFQAFMPLYEKAAPIIRHIANLDTLVAGELPVSPRALAESNLTLRPVLIALRKTPKPKEKELASIRKEFEIALSSCIKASEAAEKYFERGMHGGEGQTLLTTVISSIVLAHEYIESVTRQLAPLLEKQDVE